MCFRFLEILHNRVTVLCVLSDVLPADEDAGPVDNNVYTSAIAEVSLNNAIQVGQRLGQPTQHWEAVRDNIYIPFDEYLQFHPEYDGYPFVGNGINIILKFYSI